MKIRVALASFFLAILPLSAFCTNSPDFTLKKVAEGVYAAVGTDDGKAGSNAGFIIGSDCVAVVDTFEDVAPAQALLAEIRKLTNLPIRYVINTHYHLDHTGGNAVFAQAGATIVAHRNVRGWERTENLKFFGPNPKPEAQARVAALVLPDIGYAESLDIYLGSRLIQVRYMLGHTGGDSVVLVPDANVVFGGDLVWNAHLPNLIDASTSAWMQSLDKLLAEHSSATFVPGHGEVAAVSDVKDFRGYLAALRAAIQQAQAQGQSGEALATSVQTQLKAKYGAWGFYEYFVKHNIEQTVAELSGQKKVPVPAT
jgi:glyoxylase-like metal-dependent hydrolase (beta-lactamase superfamily II)